MRSYYFSIIIFSISIAFTSCEKDDEPEIAVPTLTSSTTLEVVEVTYTTIKVNGNVASDGGSEITSKGVCWSTNSNPTIDDNKTSESLNTFTSTITDLTANTTYYFRVYATNSTGTSYGTEQTYSTSSLDDTTWDFLLIHDTEISWHADVTFYADGTTKYDEPEYPGQYLTYGTWSLNGNTLTYDMDASNTNNTAYQFTGTISENTMSGTYTFGTNPDKSWTATLYE